MKKFAAIWTVLCGIWAFAYCVQVAGSPDAASPAFQVGVLISLLLIGGVWFIPAALALLAAIASRPRVVFVPSPSGAAGHTGLESQAAAAHLPLRPASDPARRAGLVVILAVGTLIGLAGLLTVLKGAQDGDVHSEGATRESSR